MRRSPARAIVVSCFSIGLTLAQTEPTAPAVALEGLDPVLLLLDIDAPGDPGRPIERGRFRYLFASDETRGLFEKQPERYEIQLGGHCATMGPPTWGDPDRYAVHGGRLYVFGSGRCRTQFLAEPSRYAQGAAAPLPEVAWRPAAPSTSPSVAALVERARGASGEPSATDWPQWGGPRRDFVARGVELAETWPESGPRVLWRRDLGDGYSAIAARAGRLYTLHRRGEEDVVVALDAATGKTVWEHAYAAPLPEGFVAQYGPGPHATPLVTGGRVFTAGGTAILRALDEATGKLAWSHDLYREYRGTVRVRGYAASPLAFGDLVIVPVGGAGHAVMAFRQSDGSVVWSSGDFQNSCSSPILVEVDGAIELVAFLYGEIVGLDPTTGDVRWTHPHPTDYGLNVSTPVWDGDQILVVSSAYGSGSRALRLARTDAGTRVEELWSSRRMRVHFGNTVRAGDFVYGSSGDSGPAFFTALDVRTGEPAWRDRQLARASFVVAGGKFVLLDEDGTLALATPGPAGLTILARTKLFDGVAWTVPTVSGTTLYARDRRTIVAVDLGRPGGGPARDLFRAAVERMTREDDAAGALAALRASLEAGFESPSAALREPGLEPLRNDPARRAELRALLGEHVLESDVTIVGDDEPGERLRLDLEVVERESGRAVPGARVSVYQTDDRGDYAPEARRPGEGAGNPRLFGFARTDALGRATIRSVLPGAYRGTRNARHVHVRIDRAGARPYGTAIYLDVDPPPDDEIREETARGQVVLAQVRTEAGAARSHARVALPTPP